MTGWMLECVRKYEFQNPCAHGENEKMEIKECQCVFILVSAGLTMFYVKFELFVDVNIVK